MSYVISNLVASLFFFSCSWPSHYVAFLIRFFSHLTFIFPFGIQLGFPLVPVPPFSCPLFWYSVVFIILPTHNYFFLCSLCFYPANFYYLFVLLVPVVFVIVFRYCTYWLLSLTVSSPPSAEFLLTICYSLQ